MKISIGKYTLLVLLILITALITIFSYAYLNQQEKMVAVILNSINTQVSETSYILSKNITDEEDVLKVRPLIDRMAANNDFVDAIVIHNGKDILLTTDPLYKKIIPTSLLYSNSKNIYNKLMNTVAREENIKYYKNNKAQYLKLLFVFDKKEIDNYFSKHTYNYIILKV
jgi:hypothetical protein